MFVAAPGADDVREIYSIRRMVEPAAVLWGEATPRSLDRMEQIVQNALAARKTGSVASMADANQALHEAVVALTGSQSLRRLMERVLAQMRLIFHRMSAVTDFHSHYVDRNAQLVELIRTGQRDRAAVMLRDYLDDAEMELLEHLGVAERG